MKSNGSLSTKEISKICQNRNRGYYKEWKKILYAHVFEQPIGPIALTGIDKSRLNV